MSIVNIRKVLNAQLSPLGNVSDATMSYRGGGAQQVVTFKLNDLEYEFVIPGDQSIIAGVTAAAQELKSKLENT